MSIRTPKFFEGPGAGVQLATSRLTYFIEQVAGPEKGRVIELSGEKLSIGRTEENDIVVPSDAVSRTHAFLVQSEGAWFIRDNNSKNGIQVNGVKVTESWLVNGDVVQVGNFIFRFREPASGSSEAPFQGLPQERASYQTPNMGASDFAMGAVAAEPRKKPSRRLLLYGIGGLLLAFFYISNQSSEKGDKGNVSSETASDEVGKEGQKLARDFEVAKEPTVIEPNKIFDENGRPKAIAGLEDPALKAAEQSMAKLDWSNTSLREAEQFFRKGQREYFSGNYQRAIDLFQTARSFYRGHLLADKYLRLSIFEVEKQAKKNMQMGLQYFESLQYQRAIYHFREVVNLMQHRPQEPIVAECERYINVSTRRLQAAELYP